MAKVVMKTYDTWEKVLENDSCTLENLLTTFEHIDDFSFDVQRGKYQDEN